VLLISIGILITGPLIPGPVGAWDNSINRWFLDHRTPSWNTVTDYASILAGTGTVLTIAGAAVSVMAMGRLWRELGFLLVALFVEFSVFLTTVVVVARPRPTVPKLDGAPATSSFPSGHVAASIALYISLAILISAHARHPVVRVVSWVLAVTFVVGVSISRVYRGLHHPIDVFAGVVLGIGAILVAILAIRAAGAAARDRAEAGSEARPDREPTLVRP
jgi:undecaprenyl-diphosphatase